MKIKTLAAMLAIIMIMSTGTCLADNGWQNNIIVSSDKVSSRLTFGQDPAATDSSDGFFDVPAMFSGQLQAAFSDGGKFLWRDIRDTNNGKAWHLKITSQVGQLIEIRWEGKNLPDDATVELIDLEAGKYIDMQTTTSYVMENKIGGELLIEINNI